MEEKTKIFYSVKDLIRILNLSPRTVYSLLESKQIPAVKIGKSWRIHKSFVDNKVVKDNE